MSPTTVSAVRDALNKAMQTKEFGELLSRMSLQASSPSSDFPAALKAETQRWEKSVKALNLVME
jgi:tripartite-type tricarboxylate transporter receptor subunit TctC